MIFGVFTYTTQYFTGKIPEIIKKCITYTTTDILVSFVDELYSWSVSQGG